MRSSTASARSASSSKSWEPDAAEVGGWRLEVGGWRLEAGGWRLEKPSAGSRQPKAGSRKPKAGSRQPRAGSRHPTAGSRQPRAVGRNYPDRPVVGVGAVVFVEGKVVLVRRAHEPLKGEWT